MGFAPVVLAFLTDRVKCAPPFPVVIRRYSSLLPSFALDFESRPCSHRRYFSSAHPAVIKPPPSSLFYTDGHPGVLTLVGFLKSPQECGLSILIQSSLLWGCSCTFSSKMALICSKSLTAHRQSVTFLVMSLTVLKSVKQLRLPQIIWCLNLLLFGFQVKEIESFWLELQWCSAYWNENNQSSVKNPADLADASIQKMTRRPLQLICTTAFLVCPLPFSRLLNTVSL